jgi:hypothetical protein
MELFLILGGITAFVGIIIIIIRHYEKKRTEVIKSVVPLVIRTSILIRTLRSQNNICCGVLTRKLSGISSPMDYLHIMISTKV